MAAALSADLASHVRKLAEQAARLHLQDNLDSLVAVPALLHRDDGCGNTRVRLRPCIEGGGRKSSASGAASRAAAAERLAAANDSDAEDSDAQKENGPAPQLQPLGPAKQPKSIGARLQLAAKAEEAAVVQQQQEQQQREQRQQQLQRPAAQAGLARVRTAIAQNEAASPPLVERQVRAAAPTVAPQPAPFTAEQWARQHAATIQFWQYTQWQRQQHRVVVGAPAAGALVPAPAAPALGPPAPAAPPAAADGALAHQYPPPACQHVPGE